ncbi:HNH endonuclease [Streptomyces sp. NBC_00989]|uniref:HNH endonuclease n=1 Tax=Streptomyces sp. NBC_00989 TaxID=2903705 RepID=UPI003868F543|nr:HNH endonuclease [Streptomyces sp. NBC_00989]WSW97994.1 HNH endonuclease [Streptomyces sp. NBC_00989]
MAGNPRNGRLYRRLCAWLRAQRFPCARCGHNIGYELHAKQPLSFTVDHVVPLSKGGARLDPDNAAPIHGALPAAPRAGTGWRTHAEVMNSPIPPGPPDGPLQPPDRGDRTQSEPCPARPRWKVLTHAGAALVGLFVGVLIGVTSNSSSDKAAPSATVTATVTATRAATDSTPSAAGKVSSGGFPGDGTYVVGNDIKPGTYRSGGPQGGLVTSCYWARLSSTSGEVKDIIANNATSGQTTVTIAATDKAFNTTGCKAWKEIS